MRLLAIVAACMLYVCTQASASWGEHPGEFFRRDRDQWIQNTTPLMVREGRLPRHRAAERADVQRLVARHAQAELGHRWVPSVLRIARLESSFRCNATGPKTRVGHARGVLQVVPGSARALGFDPSRLHECDYGVRAGIAHMKRCIESGVRTEVQMASCHVSGWRGWKVKLHARAEKYRRSYIRLAMAS